MARTKRNIRERERVRRRKRQRRVVILVFWLFLGSAAMILFLGGRFLVTEVFHVWNSDISESGEKIESAESIRNSPEYKAILENPDGYPDYLLEALEKNPELLDFAKGYPEAEKKAVGGITSQEENEAYPLFLQWDSRWGYAEYGEDVIGLSGCAPTCLSMVVFGLSRDKSATPDYFARYSMEQGYYVQGTGTSWELLTNLPKQFSVTGRQLGLDEEAMKNHLKKGHMIICSMRPGDFTTTGHFIVLYGYQDGGFMVHDPNSRIRSSQLWDFDTLKGQIKNLWVYE